MGENKLSMPFWYLSKSGDLGMQTRALSIRFFITALLSKPLSLFIISFPDGSSRVKEMKPLGFLSAEGIVLWMLSN